jgi:pimeloyl-ACP methyl ester carboxylesterase
MPKEFVLVHGASHGGWCWEEVEAILRNRGHRVVAPDLPGHGRRAAEARQATQLGYARAVAEAMELAGLSRAILVGHSMGGTIIPQAAQLAPGRVRHLAFLAAVVLKDGESMFDVHFAPPVQEMLRGMVAGRGDGTFLFPAETAWARWMNDLPRDHPVVARALARITPQPWRPLIDRVDLKSFPTLGIPCTYIRCQRDQAVIPARAEAYAARLGVRPVDLDTAHDPMLSQPATLARLLERVEA